MESLREQIAQRKALEAELKALKKNAGVPQKPKKQNHDFRTFIRTGDELKKFAAPVKKYKKRECYEKLRDFVYGDVPDRGFILYGLRRTGKTTMIRQMIADMTEAELAKTAFIQISAKDTLAEVNRDMKLLEQAGYQYIFLDEVTLMEDFIEGAALFSDVYATRGLHKKRRTWRVTDFLGGECFEPAVYRNLNRELADYYKLPFDRGADSAAAEEF